MNRFKYVVFFTAAMFLFTAMASQKNITSVPQDKRFEGDVYAPDFPQHLDWLNTSSKLSLQNFRGKFVLLDFWTYCCINCIHVIPDLKRLEAKYPQELVVIGVHSAKFFNEKGTESIRQAIMRYEIKHPVINDKDLEVWNQYAIDAWPSLVLINPSGKIIAAHSGEQIFEPFDTLISQAIRYFDTRGQLKRSLLDLNLEESKRPNTLLSFPGKVRGDSKTGRLFITDSNHNRILIADEQGEVLDTIGSGKAGPADGSFEIAEFNHPQGVFADGDVLYIADTENHLVRAVSLKTRQVRTVLGTGKQAETLGAKGIGTNVPLNSPWDLLVHDGKLYIAMAGSHQIYAADLKTFETAPYAGSGREARVDGKLLEAALAQPSGITTDTHRLYFADSEVSSVRSADLNPEGKVETLIGEDLFEFGDKDGDIKTARLQHPLGVEFYGGLVYIADTYNSKIKIINPVTKTVETYAGTGTHGYKDGNLAEAQFFEPGGISVLNDKIYVADTNNHQIRVIDRKTKQVSTLQISGLDKVAKQTLNPFKGRTVEWPVQTFKEGKGLISLSYILPAGYKFTEDAPFHIEWKSDQNNTVTFTSKSNKLDAGHISFPLEIPVEGRLGKDVLQFDGVIYYCRTNSSVCFFDNVKIKVPIEVKSEGPSQLDIKVDIIPKA